MLYIYIWNLFYRYFTIVRNPRGSMFRCSVAKTLILIWLVSFAAMVPLLLYQHVEVVYAGKLRLYEACVEKWPSRMFQQTFTVGLAVAQFVLPFTTISLIHLKISSYLTVHLKHPALPSKEINCRRGEYQHTCLGPSVRTGNVNSYSSRMRV